MRYEQSVLDNGLRIVSSRLGERESIGIAIWVRVGARYEKRKISGISHFLEHMLFKGTKTRSTKRIKEDVEGVGGMFNAFTGEESTCYFVKISKLHFERAFDVLQDMMNHSVLEREDFDKEKTVILEEIKMYLDLPSQYVQEVMSELLWPNQALGRPIAGTLETVSTLTRNDLVRHIRSYYQPRNFLIAVCGEMEHSYVERLAKQYFNHRYEQTKSQFRPAYTKPKHERFRFLDKKTEQTHFVIGFHGLSRNDPARYQLAILNVILGANMSSRLFEEVREKRGYAYEIKSGLGFFHDTGALTISAGVEPKKTPLAMRVIMRELKRLKQKPVPSSELRRAKDYFMGQLLLSLEDTLDHVLWYGERVLYGGDIPSYDEIHEEVERVTSDDIQSLAKRFFHTQKIHLSLIGPLGKNFEAKVRSECVCP